MDSRDEILVPAGFDEPRWLNLAFWKGTCLLMSGLGHFRPMLSMLPSGSCPICSDSDGIAALPRNDDLGHKATFPLARIR